MSNFNDVTGDVLINKVSTEEYKINYDIVMAKHIMVDPPSGWMYGFPALWDKTKYDTLALFLRAKGYPEEDIDFATSYIRMWLPTDNDNVSA